MAKTKMITISAEIVISEKAWKEAIVEAWQDRFDETITIDEVNSLDNPSDFLWAIQHVDEDCVEVSVKE